MYDYTIQTPQTHYLAEQYSRRKKQISDGAKLKKLFYTTYNNFTVTTS